MTVRHAVAHVAGRYPDRSAQQDFLTYGVDKAADLGFTGVKLFVSPNFAGALEPTYRTDYPNQAFGSPTTPLALLQDTAFATALADSRITRWFFNLWPFQTGSISNYWIHNVTPSQLAIEYQHYYDVAYWLMTNFVGKEFRLQNWEGDWALIGAFDATALVPPGRAERMAAVLRERKQGIVDARRAAGAAATSSVRFVIETNLHLDDRTDRVLSHVAPLVEPDDIGMSAYDIINGWASAGGSQAAALASIADLGRRAIARIREYNPGVPLMITEYGFPERQDNFAAFDAAELVQAVVDLADANNFTDVVAWQLYDNEVQGDNVTPRGYHMIKENGSLSIQGQKYVDDLL